MRKLVKDPEPIESSIEFAIVCLANQIALRSYADREKINLELSETPYSEAQEILNDFYPILARMGGDVKKAAAFLKENGATGKQLLVLIASCALLAQRVVAKAPEKTLPVELLMVCFETVALAEVARKFDMSRVPPFMVEALLLEQYSELAMEAEKNMKMREKLDG